MNKPIPANESEAVLAIDDLTIAYGHSGQWLNAVQEFSMHIAPGEIVGLVGESGSGKSTVALAIMRHLGQGGRVQQGQITFAGNDLLALDEGAMRQVWGTQLALVPQDPLSSLNPSIQVGEQISELLRHHNALSNSEATARSIELLELVRVPDPARVAASYPHQISGGMQQRVMIAMAVSTNPKLLILDEPTTALDVTTQAAILDLLRDLIHQQETAALYVTHNLGVVANICDRVVVLYAGELVEEAPTGELFGRPLHPYTQGLLDSVPRLGDNKKVMQLQAIPGRIPSLNERQPGCVFVPRCPLAIDLCQKQPPLEEPAAGRHIRCHRWPEILAGEIDARIAPGETIKSEDSSAKSFASDVPLLNLEQLQVHFDIRRSVREVLGRQPAQKVKAVDGVDLSIPEGKTLGLVGESGSGKTSLARAVIGLEKTSGGTMELLDFRLPSGLSKRNREMMKHLQIVFQNPEEALNPYMTVGESLRRPLITLQGMSNEEAGEKVSQLLAAVSLPSAYAQRRPNQLSGGEKQRVAIARAFAAEPELLISDEPVSALDVSVQASILNLLNDLQDERGAGNLFISHDLAVVGYLADIIAVIYAGHLMEVAPAEDLFQPPHHPYTEALLSAIPRLEPDPDQKHVRLEGDVPSQIDMPTGCPFHPRCPRYLGDICRQERPPWREAPGQKRIFCHIPIEELTEVQQS